MLVKEGPDGLSAGDIADKLSITPATLSFHLKELANSGLLESRREGRSIIYAMNVKGINALMAFLTEDCCQGRPELCVSICCEDSSAPKIKKKSGKLAA